MSRNIVCILFTVLAAIGLADNAKSLVSELSGTELTAKLESVELVVVLFCEDTKTSKCTAVTQILNEMDSDSLESLELAVTSSAQDAAVYGVDKFPTLLFFRQNTPIIFNSPEFEADDVADWLDINREVSTLTLTDETFEHDTQAASGATTGDWFVMFYKAGCAGFRARWELVAARSKHERPVASVDLSSSPGLEARFKLKDCPAFLILSQGKVYTYSGPQDIEALLQFSRTGFKKLEGVPVPPEPSGFEEMLSTVTALLSGGALKWVALVSGVVIFSMAVGLIVAMTTRKQPAKTKAKKTE